MNVVVPVSPNGSVTAQPRTVSSGTASWGRPLTLETASVAIVMSDDSGIDGFIEDSTVGEWLCASGRCRYTCLLSQNPSCLHLQ